MGCLASPPGHLPSSVRVLYSRATEDSLGARTDIYFLVARSGNELQLTGEEAVDRQPAFASRLLKVFYTRETAGREEIWSMELDGSGEGVVLAAGGVDFREPAVSPDETQIAYARNESGRSRVEVAEIDGSNPRALVAKEGSWSQPAWSPDGRTLVVVGADDGVPHLFLVEAAGGEPRPLTTGDAGPQRDPDWSADGTRIVFTRGEGSGRRSPSQPCPAARSPVLPRMTWRKARPSSAPGRADRLRLASPRWTPEPVGHERRRRGCRGFDAAR